MSFPGTRRNFHICKYGLETGFFRTARIDPETDFIRAFPHMADAHLGKGFAVMGTFNLFPPESPLWPNRNNRDLLRLTPDAVERFILIFH